VYLVHPATDDNDTFSISTFSYYGVGAPSPSSTSRRFELTHPSPTLEQPPSQGHSPPPVFPIIKRPIPRDIHVSSSTDSVQVMMDSQSRSSLTSPDLVSSFPGRRRPPTVSPLTVENVLRVWSNTVLAVGSAVGFVIYTVPRLAQWWTHPQVGRKWDWWTWRSVD
jgi:hypothetical protein